MTLPVACHERLGLPGYALVSVLGTGNRTIVYLARQRGLNRLVAVKTVGPDEPSQEILARLRREAQIVARLEIPAVVRLHELIDFEDTSYAVFEYVDGGNLRQRIQGNRLPPREAAHLGASVARAVSSIHDAGYVHLDLKPENILLSLSGETKICDFGLAAAVDSASDPASSEGASAEILGSPWYMAPEQIEKEADGVGIATDVYAVGAALYEMLAGRPPFLASERNELFELICRFPPTPLRASHPDIPRDLETICLRCLVKNPAERYRSAADLADDLDRWLRNEPIRARRVGSIERFRLWRRRNPIVATLVFLSGIVVGLTSIGFLYNYAATLRSLERSRQEEQERRENLVRSLQTVDAQSLPFLLKTFQASPDLYLPLLRQALAKEARSPRERSRGQVALMGERADFLGTFPEYLLVADVAEFESIVRVLETSKEEIPTADWDNYLRAFRAAWDDPNLDAATRFRSAVALIHHGHTQDWSAAELEKIAKGLLATNPLQASTWSSLLSPIHERLIQPLTKLFKDGSKSGISRPFAANLLAEFARQQPAILCDLLVSSEASHFRTFLLPLLEHREHATMVMLGEMEAHDSEADRETRRLRTVRRSRAAVALLRLGHAEAFWPLLRSSKDPSLRTEIIHLLRQGGVDLRILVQRYQDETDISARRSLLLSMGSLDRSELHETEFMKLVSQIESDYVAHPDPGLHAACEWLLRVWGLEPPALKDRDASWEKAIGGQSDWFINAQGQSFAVIRGPVTAMMGSPDDEPEREAVEILGPMAIDRTFAIGMKEVTAAEFKRFLPNEGSPLSENWSDDHPACRMDFYQAVQYCRWLSEQEGIPEEEMCYPPIPEIKEGFTPNPNYLRRRGYRLPSEAEMEFVMRAGAETRFGFGEWEEWLGAYAWYVKNSHEKPRPIGLLKPNDLGLFDIHGNVREWGQEWISHSGGDSVMKTGRRRFTTDVEDMSAIVNVGHYRIARSGSFRDYSFNARCARRDKQPPYLQTTDTGIRLVRTLEHHP